MSRNNSISVGDYFDNYISQEVASGRYSSATEVVEAGLRLLEQEDFKAKMINEALIKGENSPKIENFNWNDKLSEIHSKYLTK